MIYTGFRVFNAAKSKILIFRFTKTKVWTIPVSHSDNLSPANFLDYATNMLVLGRSFHFVGFIPIMSTTHKEMVWSDEKGCYIPSSDQLKVFDFQYEGVIRPRISSVAEKHYDLALWVDPHEMLNVGFINQITKSFYLSMKSKSLLNQG